MQHVGESLYAGTHFVTSAPIGINFVGRSSDPIATNGAGLLAITEIADPYLTPDAPPRAAMQARMNLLFPGKYPEVPQGSAVYVFAVK